MTLATDREVVGREEEIAEVEAFLASEAPSALLLAGEAGIGKTTIWQLGLGLARERGHRVLVARPSGADADLAFAGLADLLDEVVEESLPALPGPQRRALEVALARADADGAPPEPHAIAAGFLNVVRAAAARGAVLVAVDDVQWLDQPSADILSFAIRRLRNESVRVLATRRVERSADRPLELEWAVPRHRLHRLDVDPLSLGALHRLIRTRLGTPLSRPVLRRVHQVTGGNPFYALELAHALARRDVRSTRPGDVSVPENLLELVRDRLAALPDATQDALLAVAALSEPTVALLEKAVRTDLEPALKARVVEVDRERVRFTHPLLAAALERHADPRRWRALHRRLAYIVDDLESRARHLALATDEPEEAVAAELESGAAEAVRRGAPGAAADLLEEARRLTPPDETEAWARRTLAAARAIGAAGDVDRERELTAEVIDRGSSGETRASAIARIAPLHPKGLELCDEALRQVGRDPALAAELHKARSLVVLFSDWTAALPDAEAAVAHAVRAVDDRLLADTLAHLGLVEVATGTGDPVGHLTRSIDLEDAGEPGPAYEAPRTRMGLLLMFRDDLAGAREQFEMQLGRARDAGDEDATSALLVHLAELEWRAGNWKLAVSHAQEALDLDEQAYRSARQGASDFAVALVTAHRGELERARRHAQTGLAASRALGDRIWDIHNRSVLGFIELSREDAQAALAWIGSLHEVLVETGVREPGIYLFPPNEIEALVRVGQLDRAAERIREFEERGRDLDRPFVLATAARCRGLLLAARGDLNAALASLEQALVEHERLPMPFERARTLLALGATQRRSKKKRAARESLEHALSIFEQLGARLWAEKARAELARVGGRAPSAAELTPTERRVAEIVAEGRSNKEVARELFVSVKTVEATLSKVYTKLGVRSRAQLAHQLTGASKE